MLEVTSPGVDRPLILPRHWSRAVGRLVHVTPKTGEVIEGRVLSADDAHAVLDVDGAKTAVAYADVARAVVQVEFTRIEEVELDETDLDPETTPSRPTPTPIPRRADMDIDMSALRAVAVDKEISSRPAGRLDRAGPAGGLPPHPGATTRARVELNRDTGHVTVWAVEDVPEGAEEGFIPREFDDTPEGFGRVASTTARQVLVQRLREAEDDVTHGHFEGKIGDLVSGVVQQGQDPRLVFVDLGKVEGVLPPQEAIAAEQHPHGSRMKALVVGTRRGAKGTQVVLSALTPDS